MFTKPTDVKQWWRAPHCGPGTTDSTEECECGRSGFDCALEVTRQISTGTITELDDGGDTGQACFCSGFWCPGCGRFWAQSSCLDLMGTEYQSCDGVRLADVGDWVACPCGRNLFKPGECH